MLERGDVSPSHLSLHPIFHSYVPCGLRHECEHLIQYMEAPCKSLQTTAPCPHPGPRGEHTDATVPLGKRDLERGLPRLWKWAQGICKSTQWCRLEGVRLALWLPCSVGMGVMRKGKSDSS